MEGTHYLRCARKWNPRRGEFDSLVSREELIFHPIMHNIARHVLKRLVLAVPRARTFVLINADAEKHSALPIVLGSVMSNFDFSNKSTYSFRGRTKV